MCLPPPPLEGEVDGLVALLVGAEGVVVAGQDSIQDDADQRAHGKTGQADLHASNGERNCTIDAVYRIAAQCAGEVDSQCQTHDQSSNDDIAVLGSAA